jgi:hypothetical protein
MYFYVKFKIEHLIFFKFKNKKYKDKLAFKIMYVKITIVNFIYLIY